MIPCTLHLAHMLAFFDYEGRIASELKDCQWIGEDAGLELRNLVYPNWPSKD